MLDIRFIRQNIEKVRQNILDRNINADVDKLIDLHEERSRIVQMIDTERQKRNENAKNMKAKLGEEERQTLIERGRYLKDRIAKWEAELAELEVEFKTALEQIPNMAHPSVPLGSGDAANKELYRKGTIPQFDFTPIDHVEIGTRLDIIDFERAAQVSGAKFHYLKNEAVFLEMALLRYGMEILKKEGFSILSTPDIAREEIVAGLGFNPRGDEMNIYKLDGIDACLIGTSEITLGGYHANRSFTAEELPQKLAGVSHCFRREAGGAGQFSKGLFRVHQFTKLEMFVICPPEESDSMLEELRSIEEKIFDGLEIPYRVVESCLADLGAPAYRKYDLEAWMPGRGKSGDWAEITSTSNCTDFQARRLGIRVQTGGEQRSKFAHLLNGTAIATSRAIICILELFQQADGSVLMPKALRPYLDFDRIEAK